MLGALVSVLVTGLLVGALARLVLPGRQPIGCLLTALVGVVGAAAGHAAGVALHVGPLVRVVLAVVVAAVLVAAFSALTGNGRWR